MTIYLDSTPAKPETAQNRAVISAAMVSATTALRTALTNFNDTAHMVDADDYRAIAAIRDQIRDALYSAQAVQAAMEKNHSFRLEEV